MTFTESLTIIHRRILNGTRAHALASLGVPLRLTGYVEFETPLTAEAWFIVLESPYDRTEANRGLLDSSHQRRADGFIPEL
jgi:hypothetical protein